MLQNFEDMSINICLSGFTCGCRVMGVNHPGLIPRPILWLCLVKFSPNELIGSLRLALEPLEVLKMIHDVACLNLLLKNVSLVKEKNKGCMVQPGVKLDLSEQLNRLFKSVESLAIFSLQVRVVFIDSREEDYTCHTLLKYKKVFLHARV